MKKNVLIFPSGSEIGLEIHRSLNYSTHFHPIGGSSVPDHAEFVYDDYVGGLPDVRAPDFAAELARVVAQRHVDVIIPAHDDVVLTLARERAAGTLDCPVVTSPLRTCEIARSKRSTYRHLAPVVRTPTVYDDTPPTEFPVFLKPDVGQGSRGTHVAADPDAVEFYLKRDPDLLVMEYLPGAEYTVDCFTDKDGTLRYCEGRERIRIRNGISVRSAPAQDERFRQIASALSSVLAFRGVWFFQVKANAHGDFVLMEFAPRVAGTMALARCRGVNLVLLSLFDALGHDVAVFENRADLVIDRALTNRYRHDIAYRHVYLDLDDLLIVDDQVHPQVAAFLYQCRNRSVEIHLITRHGGDLAATLRRHRVAELFDEIIWLAPGDEKHRHIRHRDAIFVDDSFAERQQVHEHLGLPTFDAHMIESLLG